jgi:hypothetical protein
MKTDQQIWKDITQKEEHGKKFEEEELLDNRDRWRGLHVR